MKEKERKVSGERDRVELIKKREKGKRKSVLEKRKCVIERKETASIFD